MSFSISVYMETYLLMFESYQVWLHVRMYDIVPSFIIFLLCMFDILNTYSIYSLIFQLIPLVVVIPPPHTGKELSHIKMGVLALWIPTK